MRVYLLIMLFAAVITYLLVPLILHIALSVGAITQVRQRDVHKVPIARLGGTAMYLGLLITFVLASQIPFLQDVYSPNSAAWGIVLGSGFMCLVGTVDDIWELNWYTKLAGEILAAGIMAWFGVQLISLPFLGITIGSERFTLIGTILVVVVVVNAVNFIDGLDGLAAGVIGIAACAFFCYAYYLVRISSPGDYASVATAVVAALVGVCAGFLPHNFHPARIFMGDSGALMLGAVISGAAILITGQIDPANVNMRVAMPAFMPLLIPAVILLIPLIDFSWAVVRRLRQGRSPFMADSGHLHHRLLRRGHSQVTAVLVLYLWAGVASFSGVIYTIFPYSWVLALIGVAILGSIYLTVQKFSAKHNPAIAADSAPVADFVSAVDSAPGVVPQREIATDVS